MKIYKVKVNGKVYQVELESVETTQTTIETSQPVETGKETILSPMQGTIQKINITKGQHVKKGESLFILEAMKLENDITAEHDLVIADVLVKEGDTVNQNQALVKVK